MQSRKTLTLSLVAVLALAAGSALAVSYKSPIEAMASDSGMPQFLGRYDATGTSKTNAQATDAFNATAATSLAGKTLLIINNGGVEISIYPVTTTTGTVTRTYAAAANLGVPVAAGARVTLTMGPSHGYLAVITASSTANVDVWELM